MRAETCASRRGVPVSRGAAGAQPPISSSTCSGSGLLRGPPFTGDAALRAISGWRSLVGAGAAIASLAMPARWSPSGPCRASVSGALASSVLGAAAQAWQLACWVGSRSFSVSCAHPGLWLPCPGHCVGLQWGAAPWHEEAPSWCWRRGVALCWHHGEGVETSICI